MYNMKAIVPSLTVSSTVGLYVYGNAGQAASQTWCAMSNHRFGLQEVRGSNPGGTPLFRGVSLKWLETSWSVTVNMHFTMMV